ncbi:MAG: autotransporter domain-containing protein [Cohaesibacteraceae bacterium]|nr:autotransporter domain-containing protein [Cohaesibacteraceae bacterium]
MRNHKKSVGNITTHFGLLTSVACLTLLTGGQSVFAADFTIGNAVTAKQTLTANENGTVETGGSVIVTGDHAVEVTGAGVTINNDGTISATANSTQAISAGTQNNLTVTNTANGKITSAGTGTPTNVYAISTADGLTVSNSGIISSGRHTIDATDNATITNSGTISSGNVNNTRTIDVNNDAVITNLSGGVISAGSGDSSFAIQVDARATITNYGIISSGNGSSSDTIVLTSTNNVIVNHGMISAGNSDAIFAQSSSNNNTVTNYGTITAGDDGIQDRENSTIINHGIITVVEDGVQITSGTITNTGTITSGNSSRTGTAAIHVGYEGNGDAIINNSGTLQSSLGPSGNAMYFDDGSQTVNLNTGSRIIGKILWDGTNDTLNINNRHATTVTLTGRSSNGAAATVTTSLPSVIQSSATQTIVSTIDPALFAADAGVISDTGFALLASVNAARQAAQSGAISTNGSREISYAPQFWFEGFGSFRQRNDGSVHDNVFLLGGAASGVDKQLGNGKTVGAFFGGAFSRLDAENDDRNTDTASFYAGAGVGQQLGNGVMDFRAMLGYSFHQTSRQILDNKSATGYFEAKADYSSLMFVPELSYTHTMQLSDTISLSPRFTGRYAAIWMQGYTETGDSTGNISVKDRISHSVQGEFSLTATRKSITDNAVLQQWITGGISGQMALGSDKTEVTLLSQDLSFSSGREKSSYEGFVEAGFSYTGETGTKWSLQARGGYGSSQTISASLRGRVTLSF